MTEVQRPDSKNRQTVGLLLGVGLGVVLVLAVLFVTLSAGDSGGSDPSDGDKPAKDATPTTAPLPDELDAPIVVPPGDYEALCDAFLEQATGVSGGMTPAQLREFYARVDFEPLIAVAPEGLVPSLETIRDDRDEVLVALDNTVDFNQLDTEGFPEGFLRAFATVTVTANAKCTAHGG